MKKKNILVKQNINRDKTCQGVMEHKSQANKYRKSSILCIITIKYMNGYKKQVLIQNSLKKKQKYNVKSKVNILTSAPKH